MADMESIMEIAERYQLKVIEDATEALGTYYTDGKYKGNMLEQSVILGHIRIMVIRLLQQVVVALLLAKSKVSRTYAISVNAGKR